MQFTPSFCSLLLATLGCLRGNPCLPPTPEETLGLSRELAGKKGFLLQNSTEVATCLRQKFALFLESAGLFMIQEEGVVSESQTFGKCSHRLKMQDLMPLPVNSKHTISTVLWYLNWNSNFQGGEQMSHYLLPPRRCIEVDPEARREFKNWNQLLLQNRGRKTNCKKKSFIFPVWHIPGGSYLVTK